MSDWKTAPATGFDAAERAPGFYWVRPIFDPDTDNPPGEYPNCDQPAYWDGLRWELLGTEDWGVCWVGERIQPPATAGD